MNSEKIKALAINGGTPVRAEAFPPRGHFTKDEKAACDAVMDKAIAAGVAPGYGGEEEKAFCEEFAELMGGGYADAVSSGTAAVFVALAALELEPYSEVIIGPITDPGGVMPIVMCNCIPVVADSAEGSFNVSLEGIKKVYTERTRAIIVPHIAGDAADIENICAFAKEKGLKVIEDCAQAHGTKMNGKRVGTFGDIGAFSMMFGKHVCTGGQGGMVFTKDEDLYWKIKRHADRGKPFGMPEDKPTCCVAALNFNLDELHCAIGRVQIKKIDDIAARRRVVYAKIKEAFKDIPEVSIYEGLPGAESSHWFVRFILDLSKISCDKITFASAIQREGIWWSLNPDYGRALVCDHDWYRERNVFGESKYPWAAPEYKGDGNKVYNLVDDIPNAANAVATSVTLTISESWDDQAISDLAAMFRKVLDAYQK